MPDNPKSMMVYLEGAAGEATTFFPPTVHVYSPLPADHPFYSMVGRVASEWSHLEHILDLAIWDLAAWKTSGLSQERLACITSQILGVPPRCKVIVSLGKTHNLDYTTVLKPFVRLMQDSYSSADWRARWIHDPWYTDTGNPGAPPNSGQCHFAIRGLASTRLTRQNWTRRWAR